MQRTEEMDVLDKKTRQQFTRCQYHRDEVYTMFCNTCDCLVCTSCILDNRYKQHEFRKISDVIARKHDEFCKMTRDNDLPELDCEGQSNGGKRRSQARAKEIMLKTLREMKTKDTELNSLCDTLSKKINDRTDFLIQNLETERTCLLTKVTNAKTSILHRSSSQKNKIELCISYLNIYETDSEFINGLEDVFRIRMTEILKSTLQTNGSKGNKNISTFLKYTVQDEKDVPGVMKSLIGDVTFSQEDEIRTNQSQCAKANHKKVTENQSRVKKKGIVRQIKIKRAYNDSMNEVGKILPVDDGSLYILTTDAQGWSHSNQNLYLTVNGYETLQLVCMGVIDFCADKRHNIYVCTERSSAISRYTRDGKCFAFVDCGPDYIVRCLHFEDELDQLMAVVEKTNNNYIEAQVAVFNTTRQRVRVIDCGSRHLAEMKPFRITNGATSPLLLMKLVNNAYGCGIVYDLVTQRAIFNGAIGLQPAETFRPTGICVDDQGQILVSDYNNHLVYLLHPDGKFKKILLSQEDGVICPGDIALDKKGFLWIECGERILVVDYQSYS